MSEQKLEIISKAFDEALRGYMLGGCTEEQAQVLKAAAKAQRDAVDAYHKETEAEAGEKSTLIDQMKVDLIQSVGMVNDMADNGDLEQNWVNYGIATQTAKVLHRLGVAASVLGVYGDNEYLRVPAVVIEGKEIKYCNGHHPSPKESKKCQ